MMRNVLKALAVVALLSMSVTAFAQATQQQTQETQQAHTVDELFVIVAAQGDMYEINSSQLALERSENEAIRNFAQRMIDDHTMTTERLSEVAAEVGVVPQIGLSLMHQLMIEQLTELQGEAFDHAYVRQQVLAHRNAVAVFEIAADMGENEAVRNFASENLPALREHLQMAQELMQELGISEDESGANR